MTTTKAIRILTEYNEWRRGAEIPMHSPGEIGQAIDRVLLTLKQFKKMTIIEGYWHVKGKRVAFVKTEDIIHNEEIEAYRARKEAEHKSDIWLRTHRIPIEVKQAIKRDWEKNSESYRVLAERYGVSIAIIQQCLTNQY